MTFGDCMSLLVTFFVMLIAFSNMEEDKLAEMIGAMRGALGAIDRFDTSGIVAPIESELLHTLVGDAEDHRLLTQEELSGLLPRFVEEIRKGFADQDALLPDRFIIRMLEEGLVVVLQTQALFHDGSAEWAADYHALWEGLAWLLRGRENELRITALLSEKSPVWMDSAHTAWGLGIARAEAVAFELQRVMQAPAARFGVGTQVTPDKLSGSEPERLAIQIMSLQHVRDVDAERVLKNGAGP